MTDAEIVAYLLGSALVAELDEQLAAGADNPTLRKRSLTVDERRALDRLGPEVWAAWVQRGSNDAMNGK